jgi:hypothetical protein
MGQHAGQSLGYTFNLKSKATSVLPLISRPESFTRGRTMRVSRETKGPFEIRKSETDSAHHVAPTKDSDE